MVLIKPVHQATTPSPYESTSITAPKAVSKWGDLPGGHLGTGKPTTHNLSNLWGV